MIQLFEVGLSNFRHGLAAIACMSGVIPSFDWDEMLEGDELLR